MTNHRTVARRQILQGGGSVLLSMTTLSPAIALAATDATLTPVAIANAGATISLVLAQLLKQQGYLADFGIDGHYLNVSDGSKIIGALVSGHADLCSGSGFSGVFPAIESGARLKLIGAANMLTEQAIFSAKPNIRTVADLVGRTVGSGAPGALTNQMIVALLHKKGIDPKQVTFVDIGSNADIFKAVAAGTVDAGPAAYDVYEDQARYGVHSLVDGDLWTELPEFTDQAAYASDQAIAGKRDLLVRVIAAYVKLYRYLQGPDSKDAFARARATVLGRDAPAAAASQWEFFRQYQPYALNPVLSEERVRYMQALNVELGIQKQILPFDQVADMSLARDALKLIA